MNDSHSQSAQHGANKIDQLFARRGDRKLLSLYFCAGDPTADQTADTLLTLQRRGIDMVEVGIPFSDPLADGPVIQSAATRALRQGMTLGRLFAQLRAVSPELTMPVVLMGYLNVVMHYGYARFFADCEAAGVSGCIIPDLPMDDYLSEVKPLAEAHGVRMVMMITPETSDERIRLIDRHTEGFIYMVSTAGTTGAQQRFDERSTAYFERVERLGLRNPRMIGFGISNRSTLAAAQQHAAGAIIGSKFVQLLHTTGQAEQALDMLEQALESW